MKTSIIKEENNSLDLKKYNWRNQDDKNIGGWGCQGPACSGSEGSNTIESQRICTFLYFLYYKK